MAPLPTILAQLLCVLALTAVVLSKQKPKPAGEYFKLCSRKDPKELNKCVMNTIMEMKPLLKKGIPALNLVPLEPLVIPRMELNQGSGSFALKTTLSNFTINGLGGFVVESANFTINDGQFYFELVTTTPKMLMTAFYEMSGQILVIPIRGNGDCEMNFTDVYTASTTRGHIVNRGGQDYIELDDLKWDIQVRGKSRSWFYNLFNGDKRLGDATNNFLNNNGQEAFQAIKHLPEEAFGRVIKDISSNVYKQYPVTELFLD